MIKKGLFPRRPAVNTKLRLKAVIIIIIIIIPFGVDIHIYNILRILYRCVRFHTRRIYRIPKLWNAANLYYTPRDRSLYYKRKLRFSLHDPYANRKKIVKSQAHTLFNPSSRCFKIVPVVLFSVYYNIIQVYAKLV